MFTKKGLKKILAFLPVLVLFVPVAALASNAVGQGLSGANFGSLFGTGISSDTTLSQLIFDVIQILLLFTGAIAVLFVIIGGYFYLTAQGNEEQSEKGKTTLVNAIIGIIIIIMSYTIINVIQNTINGN